MRWSSLVARIGCLTLVGCVAPQTGEDPTDWFDDGTNDGVVEPMRFTDQPYDFPATASDGLGYLLDNLFPVPSGPSGADQVAWGAVDMQLEGGAERSEGCPKLQVPELPKEIVGVATLHPRYYFKTSGCSWASDEKYYGSFFLEDSTGGVFMLGNTRVAHFDSGDKIRVSIRAAKTSFDLDMVYAYDLLEIVERGVPIFYKTATMPFKDMVDSPVGETWRVEGEVLTEQDTFGAFTLEDDAGNVFDIALDAELNRRGVHYEVGSRIRVTGPVLFSYDLFQIVVMRKGQVTEI